MNYFERSKHNLYNKNVKSFVSQAISSAEILMICTQCVMNPVSGLSFYCLFIRSLPVVEFFYSWSISAKFWQNPVSTDGEEQNKILAILEIEPRTF